MLGKTLPTVSPLKGSTLQRKILKGTSPLPKQLEKQESFGLGDDIHNLCDDPADHQFFSTGGLGVIHEDSAGHAYDAPKSPTKKKIGTHSGTTRLTTEEFSDQQDQIAS